MRKMIIAATFAAAFTGQTAQGDEVAALAEEGKALIQEFGSALKGKLLLAMNEGGPVNAIAVCHEAAPEIAQSVSTDGWTVARSSHRLRNPDNAPDAFTAATIEDFLAREAAGEGAQDLVRAAIVEEDGSEAFHLVKAIPTDKVCLSCHGAAEVAPETEAKLAELYPQDEARGFSLGEMRGVFTLTKTLTE